MTEEVKPTEEAAPLDAPPAPIQEPAVEPPPAPAAPPILNSRDEAIFIFTEAANSIGKYIQDAVKIAEETKAPAQLDMDSIFKALLNGIGEASAKLEKGLVPVSIQEAQVLGVFRKLRDSLQPGEELKFVKIKEPPKNALLGPNGQPLSKDGPKIIVAK